jgi:uncharacterized protein YcsI (UPF0317 family)
MKVVQTPSWPVDICTILGDLVMGNSTHLPWEGSPCLIPKACDLPVYNTYSHVKLKGRTANITHIHM